MPFFYIIQEKSEAWRVQLGTLLAVDLGFCRILSPGESDPVDMRVPWAVSLQHRRKHLGTSSQGRSTEQMRMAAACSLCNGRLADLHIVKARRPQGECPTP